MVKKLGGKIFLIVFALLIALGFTLPVIDFNGEQEVAEPRICQTDSDCYLTCDDTPVAVLCSNNLCQQNSCNEQGHYLFKEVPTTFSLEIENASNLTKIKEKDFFITYNQREVKFFATGLSLGHFLEKAGLTEKYDLFVNGEKSYQFDQYVPQEGDEIRLVYS